MSNSPRVTIQDIAQSLGVPVAQVTKVILGQPGVSDDSRRQVMAALVQAGLVRISRGTSGGMIGVVVPNVLMGDYIGDVVRGITETARLRGYSVALNIETTAKSADLVQMLEPGGCDGVIGIVPNNYRDFLDAIAALTQCEELFPDGIGAKLCQGIADRFVNVFVRPRLRADSPDLRGLQHLLNCRRQVGRLTETR